MAIYVKTESGVAPLFPSIDKNITDWNSAVTSGFYHSEAGAANGPVTDVPLAGNIITSGNLVIQQVYPEDTSKEELVYYLRKGFVADSVVTWTKWFITNLYLEEVLTYMIKGYDASSKKNLFQDLTTYFSSTARSIIFTDIKMPSNAKLIDVDEDGDSGVVAWFDPDDKTKLYVSTQNTGIKVEGNTNSRQMFYYASLLTSIDFSNFDTSKIVDMTRMFESNRQLQNIDVSKWNTSNVRIMTCMFVGCNKLTTLDVSNWNISNVQYMDSMFSGCTGLTTLDVSKWNTSNVLSLYCTFLRCSSLTTLDVSNWNTSNVTNMLGTFAQLENITYLDLSSFDTSKVTKMDEMFNGSDALTTIKVGDKFKWICTLDTLCLDGTWQDEEGNQYTSSDTFPSNVAHTYTKVS